MKDWHLEHVEKVIVRYVRGLSPNATSFEKRNFKKYSTMSNCTKQIEYDKKHGVFMGGSDPRKDGMAVGW